VRQSGRSVRAASWLVLGAIIVLLMSAMAQVSSPRLIHVDKVTCAEMLSLPRELNDRLLIFFNGFTSGMRQRMVWDERVEGEIVERAVGYCKANPSETLLSAFIRAAPR
jgi:HdeA/HdeB family